VFNLLFEDIKQKILKNDLPCALARGILDKNQSWALAQKKSVDSVWG